MWLHHVGFILSLKHCLLCTRKSSQHMPERGTRGYRVHQPSITIVSLSLAANLLISKGYRNSDIMVLDNVRTTSPSEGV